MRHSHVEDEDNSYMCETRYIKTKDHKTHTHLKMSALKKDQLDKLQVYVKIEIISASVEFILYWE